MKLEDYGWDEFFKKQWGNTCCSPMQPGLVASDTCCSPMQPGRIIADYGQMLRVVTESGEILVSRPYKKDEVVMQIAVGDWVALEHSIENNTTLIRDVLVRKTKFSRAASGIEVKEQIVAANVDTVFIIQSQNRDFNVRRLERYMIAAWESGALPVIVLTKADCCNNSVERLSVVNDNFPGVDVHSISCLNGEGINEIKKYFVPGKTVALLGSSGVGKSTLVNMLAGKEVFKTQEIREGDSRGRHTTTHREILLLPGGGLILDTPGMRSLSLWEAETGMETLFGDVEELTRQCRFYDCKHDTEPDCAVREAIGTGKLEIKRWESWSKLQKELVHIEAKKEGKLRLKEREWGRQIAKVKKGMDMGRK